MWASRVTSVSIITPAHRAEPFLGRAVASVCGQTYRDWELLVVSDDGVDYRAWVARAGIDDARIRFLATPTPASGPAAARNLALAEARGDLIAPLDADDLFYPERLACLVPLAERYGMAGDNVRAVDDGRGEWLATLFPEGSGPRWIGLRDYARTSIPMTFVFRRDVLTWRWEEGIGFAEDTLFNLRGFEALGRVPVSAAVLHEYRVRPGSLCHAPDSAERAELAYTMAIDRLARDGLGFRTPAARLLVRELLVARRSLNRAFRASLAAGRCQDFQEFIAGRVVAPDAA